MRHKASGFGARIALVTSFSAEKYVHLFVKRLIMTASVTDSLVAVLTQCEHSHVALIYGFCYEFCSAENKNY